MNTSNRFLVGFDLDDVLVQLNRGFIDWYNHLHGTRLTLQDIINYMFGPVLGIPQEEANKLFIDFYFSEAHNFIRPVGQIFPILNLLHELDVYKKPLIITSRPEDVRPQTVSLVQRNFPRHQFGGLYLAKSAHVKPGQVILGKPEICLEYGVNLMFEDSGYHAEKISSVGIPVILRDCPWNQDFPDEDYPLVTRVPFNLFGAAKILRYYKNQFLETGPGVPVIPYKEWQPA